MTPAHRLIEPIRRAMERDGLRERPIMKKHLVSAALLALAAKKAEAIMAAQPHTKEDWLDQVRTSKVSRADGGTVLLETEYDWVPAFFIWYHGGGHHLPREK